MAIYLTTYLIPLSSTTPMRSSSYLFPWSWPVLCHGIPGPLIGLCYCYDCYRRLRTSSSLKIQLQAILKAAPATPTEEDGGRDPVIPGVSIPHPKSFPLFPKPFFYKSVASLVVSQIILLLVISQVLLPPGKWSRNMIGEWYIFPALSLVIWKGEYRDWLNYEEKSGQSAWNIRPLVQAQTQ